MMRLDPSRIIGVLIAIGLAGLLLTIMPANPVPVAELQPTVIPQTATPTPTLRPSATPDLRTAEQLCFDLDKYWNRDWMQVIVALERLRENKQVCGDKDPTLMLYPAYFNYGVALERRGRRQEAIAAYQRAHRVNPDGTEAAEALKKLGAFTPEPPAECQASHVSEAIVSIPMYRPHRKDSFVRLVDGRFERNGQPFIVRGVNYYPMRAPWRRFLTEMDLDTVARELDLIKGVGMNTIRIFLWYPALFDCPGSGLVPRADAFARLDGLLALAAERDLYVLVTLNDLPDLTVRPLYLYPELPAAQTTYLIERYRDEPTLLAWDLRNEGDIDITRARQPGHAVYQWLTETGALVRSLDPNHPITAGWLSNPLPTDPAVDFFSFHHWVEGSQIPGRMGSLRDVSPKPALLQEVGYSTFGGDERLQANRLLDAVSAAESAGMLGWLVWVAFDFPTDVTCIPPACPSQENGQHHFGLWRIDYTPKPAVDALRTFIARAGP